MIFDKAMEGCNTSQICYYMNEQKVPTPGKYNQMNGLLRQGNYKMPDKEVVWDTGMIRTILGRFEYTGALVMGRRHTVAVGSKVTRKTAERDVVIRKCIYYVYDKARISWCERLPSERKSAVWKLPQVISLYRWWYSSKNILSP